MTGRLRSVSNSTVATVDDSRIRYRKESSILRPAPPDTPDSQWPCFVLTEAQVFRSDGKTLANPLHVDLEGPVIVRGKLEVSDDDDELIPSLVKRNTKSAYIEISRSERYSIGYQPVTLWVAGAAGWFEIVPAPEYEGMYRQVQEAITLYYSVMEVYDKHKECCKKARKVKMGPPPPPSIDDILFKYALTRGDGILRHEAEACCHKWAQFLIAQFPKEADLSWDGTLFSEWMHTNNPGLKQRIADTAAGLVPPVPIPPVPEPTERPRPRRRRSPSTQTSSRGSEDIEMADSAPARSTMLPPGKKMSNTPVPLPTYIKPTSQQQPPPPPPPQPQISLPVAQMSSSQDTESVTPVDCLWSVISEVAAESKNLHKTKHSKFLNEAFFKCKITQYRWREPIVSYFAKDLLPRLSTPEWQDTPFKEWIEQATQNPTPLPNDLPESIIPSQMVRRKLKVKVNAAGSPPATPTIPAPQPRARIKTYTQPLKWDDEDEDEIFPQGKHPPPHIAGSRRSGKNPVLRPFSSKKRPASELDDDSAHSGSRRGRKISKRNRPWPEDDDGDEDEYDSSDASSIKNEDDHDYNSYMFPSQAPHAKEAVRVIVHAERLPTMSPSGPNGTWTCDQDECGYVVRAAEEQAGKELIQSHFRWHESQAEKISLAVTESRGQLPINHLLEKLQDFGHKKDLRKRGTLPNGELLKPPIKRKLLI